MTYNQKANKDIVRFMKNVVSGVREEYEKGASARRDAIDLNSLEELLIFKDRKIKERLEIIYEIAKDSTNTTVPMIRKEIELLKELI